MGIERNREAEAKLADMKADALLEEETKRQLDHVDPKAKQRPAAIPGGGQVRLVPVDAKDKRLLEAILGAAKGQYDHIDANIKRLLKAILDGCDVELVGADAQIKELLEAILGAGLLNATSAQLDKVDAKIKRLLEAIRGAGSVNAAKARYRMLQVLGPRKAELDKADEVKLADPTRGIEADDGITGARPRVWVPGPGEDQRFWAQYRFDLSPVRLLQVIDIGQAAREGDAAAQYRYGLEKDRGGDRNETEVARYYRLAAEQGYSSAQYSYGCCLQDGRGIVKNAEEDPKYYKMVIAQAKAEVATGTKLPADLKDSTGQVSLLQNSIDVPGDGTYYRLSADPRDGEEQPDHSEYWQSEDMVKKEFDGPGDCYTLANSLGPDPSGYRLNNGTGVAPDHGNVAGETSLDIAEMNLIQNPSRRAIDMFPALWKASWGQPPAQYIMINGIYILLVDEGCYALLDGVEGASVIPLTRETYTYCRLSCGGNKPPAADWSLVPSNEAGSLQAMLDSSDGLVVVWYFPHLPTRSLSDVMGSFGSLCLSQTMAVNLQQAIRYFKLSADGKLPVTFPSAPVIQVRAAAVPPLGADISVLDTDYGGGNPGVLMCGSLGGRVRPVASQPAQVWGPHVSDAEHSTSDLALQTDPPLVFPGSPGMMAKVADVLAVFAAPKLKEKGKSPLKVLKITAEIALISKNLKEGLEKEKKVEFESENLIELMEKAEVKLKSENPCAVLSTGWEAVVKVGRELLTALEEGKWRITAPQYRAGLRDVLQSTKRFLDTIAAYAKDGDGVRGVRKIQETTKEFLALLKERHWLFTLARVTGRFEEFFAKVRQFHEGITTVCESCERSKLEMTCTWCEGREKKKKVTDLLQLLATEGMDIRSPAILW
jgi:TPR repeat protein